MNKAQKLLIAAALIGFTTILYAQGVGIDNYNLFDNILNRFNTTASTWQTHMISSASWLFWSLVLISMTWTYGQMALRKADLQEFFAETVSFLVTTGFFYWLLCNGPAISMSIIDSLRLIAAKASGLDKLVSPSTIVDVGFDIVAKAIDHSSIWSPANTTVGLIIAGIILIAFALIGVNLLLVLISGWVVCYGGIFLLGFGGGRWTQDIAINYYKTVLGIALESFAMILIIGIGKSFIDQYYAALPQDITLKEMFVMLVVATILLAIINKIPPMLAGIAAGGGHGGGGGIGLGAGMAAAGLAGSALASGAASVGGGASALYEAFKAASQSTSSGNNLGGEGAKPQGVGGLAQAMGQAASFAASFGSHLSAGAMDVMKDKVDLVKEDWSSRISETTGGKMAQSINERAQDSNSQPDNQIPEGSLSAGSADSTDEVSQFVNKSNAAE